MSFLEALVNESAMAVQSAQCANPAVSAAIPDDCSFYSDCLEPTFECGPDGYPMGYGFKYCNRFLEEKDRFSAEGQEWIDGTLVCLKQALVPTVNSPDGITCDNVKKTAFDSHVDCYIENGFCDLAFDYSHPGEMTKFVYDLMHVYEFKDFA